MALGGQAIGLVAGAKPGPAEGIGILAAIIIMLLAFGSVVAMGLPIITALFGIAVAFAVLDLLSHVVTTPIFAPEIMAMIGLGVGIDYALFVVTRYRQGLAEGREPRDAVAVSLATSGRAVVFAGTHGHPVAARAVPAAAALHAGPGHRGHLRGGAGHAGRH